MVGVQRYKCKDCGGTFIAGDNNGLEKRLKVINMYLEGVGIRSIERLEGGLVIYWIRHFARLVKKEVIRRPVPNNPKDISIVEIDDIKKDQKSIFMACCGQKQK